MRACISRIDADIASAGRPQVTRRRREAWKWRRRAAELGIGRRDHVILDVGCVTGWVAACERGERCRADCKRPGAQQDVFETYGSAAEIAIRDLVERRGVAHPKELARLTVVLQVLANAGELMPYLDAMLVQQRRRANAGELQDLR